MPKVSNNIFSEKRKRSLTLIATMSCNLKCSYCYEKNDPTVSRIMSIKIAKEAITNSLCAKDEFDSVLIDFFGGEPLLAFPLIRETIEWTISREWPKKYHFFIGTNGTLLTDEMKNWFSEKRNLLTMGFSINGNKLGHDFTRDNSYDLLAPHIPFFIKNWPHQPAKMTICAENIPYVADSIIELEKMELLFTANVASEDYWGPPEQREKLLDIYNEQLMRLVDFYLEHIDLYPVSRILDSVPSYLGKQKVQHRSISMDCTRFCGAGHEMVLVDVDGSTYPCHRFHPSFTGKPAPEGPTNIQKQWNPQQCHDCKIVNLCPTCAGYNWEVNNNTGIRTTYHCEAIKLEVLASAKLAALRLQKRPLDELESMTPLEQKKFKNYLNVLLELIEEGL
jgi:uncharacterized protein